MSYLNLIGKDEAFESIMSAYNSKMLSHAILIEGDRGVGKKTLANAVCKLLLCDNDKKPCGKCNACQKLEKKIHPDVFEIFPAGKSRTVGVKEIETVKHNIFIKPNDADYKIFLIHNAERMNVHAQNAMLKMIEEPPQDTFFIFTCENSHALLATVLSRVTVYRVSGAEIKEVKNELKRLFSEKSDAELENAAALSCGNMGLAIEIVNGEKSKLYADAVKILNSLVSKDKALLCLSLGKYSKKKEEAIELVSLLKLAFRDICAQNSGDKSSYSGLVPQIQEVSKRLGTKGALLCMSACDEFLKGTAHNAALPLSLTALEININNAIKV